MSGNLYFSTFGGGGGLYCGGFGGLYDGERLYDGDTYVGKGLNDGSFNRKLFDEFDEDSDDKSTDS